MLRHLHEQLDGQPISIILTDAAGMVLTRLTADHDLERALDGIKLAPGFSYAEERVGTNGIGTALESGGPAHVFGHEHYAESLESFGCAGVPIHDPVSGKTVGVLNLTWSRANADACWSPWSSSPPIRSPRPCWPRAAAGTCTCSRSTCGPAGGPAASCWPSATTS